MPFAALLAFLLLTASAAGCARPPMTAEPFTDTPISQLADAVAGGDTAAIRRQLEQGDDPQTRGSDGANLLVWAIDRELAGSVEALLEGGANPNYSDADGKTPVHAAAFADDTRMLRAVLAHGGNPDIRNGVTRATPLAAAVLSRNRETPKVLLDAGADPDLGDFNQDRPLHVAAVLNDGAAILLLLEHGASPTATNADGESFQRAYFNHPRALLNDRALAERRQIVAWLKANQVPLEANVEAGY